MRSLEKGQDKIQIICDKLRQKTIDPAKSEAANIVANANQEAEKIKAAAELEAQQLIKQAKGQIEQERNVFHSSLQQASKQAIEALKQQIEHKFFNDELQTILDKQLADPKVIANLLSSLVGAIEKDGINSDLTAVIPKAVSPDEINALLLDSVAKKLKGKPMEIGSFAGGAQVKIHGKKMTLDLTDQAIKELIATYMRKDFRKMIFSH